MAIKDADSHAEYCLECIRKHLDTSLANLDEIEQRLIYNPEPDKKVRKKVESIIRDLEAAEQHALDTQNTTDEEREVLGDISNSLRKTRKLLEMTKLGYREEGITPVGGLADIQLAKGLMDNHISQVHNAIAEIGCGDCDTAEAQMILVKMRKDLRADLEKPSSWLGQMYAPELQEIVEETDKVLTEHIVKAVARKTLVQRIIEQRAKECKTQEEPQVCLTIAANEIRDLKVKRGDPVIPSTAQLLDKLNEEMKK